MAKTSPAQIDFAKAMATALAANSLFAAVHVDDWSDYGSFRIFARLKGRWTGNPGYSHFIPDGEDLQQIRGRQARAAVRNGSIEIRRLLHRLKPHGVVKEFLQAPKLVGHKVINEFMVDGYNTDAFKLDFTVLETADKTAAGL